MTTNGTGRTLTLNLNSHSTTSAAATAIVNALVSYATTTALTNALAAYTNTAAFIGLLENKLSTSHETGKVGNAGVDLGNFNVSLQTMMLKDSNGMTGVLSSDNGGYLSIGADDGGRCRHCPTFECLRFPDAQNG